MLKKVWKVLMFLKLGLLMCGRKFLVRVVKLGFVKVILVVLFLNGVLKIVDMGMLMMVKFRMSSKLFVVLEKVVEFSRFMLVYVIRVLVCRVYLV